MLKNWIGRVKQSLPKNLAQDASKVKSAASPVKSATESTGLVPTEVKNASTNAWTSLKRLIPDTSKITSTTSEFVANQTANLDAATRQGVQYIQKAAVETTSKTAKFAQEKAAQSIETVRKAAVDTTTKGVEMVRNAAVDTTKKGVEIARKAAVDTTSKSAEIVQKASAQISAQVAATAKQSAQYVHERTTKKVTDAGAALLDSSKQKLQQTTQTIVETTAAVDPRAKMKRLRNQLLALVFSGIFVYGFASSLPSALAKYAAEMQKQAKVEKTTQQIH
ncbi:hypothetical protein LEN26_014953 [Aphanomyces euteiches]|nr:hypothetical protein LEN26_014953 [Aphanomyces euteiches]KAH9128023.1 hypothetical protein AeMF1_001766 [Aphanomyces euteiches]KAH9186874.1 hypothetical protein AeNC1_011146 [Aphanomyces euteiches]